ncbi:MAG: DUF748 domain-containing protein [Candidatus Sulfobium sp.]
MINIPAKYRKILIGIALFFAFYTLIGFVVLPPIAKSVIEKKLDAALHRQTTLQKVSFNPYTLHVVLKGLAVREKAGTKKFASFQRLSINIQAISLFKGGIVIKQAVLEKPYLRIVRNREHSYNVSDLISRKKPQKKEPFMFSVSAIRISGGTLDFEDLPMGKKHEMTDITLVVPFLSDRPDYAGTFVRPEFSGKIDGSPFRFTGKTIPFSESRETLLDVDVTGFNIPYYFSYLPLQPGVALKSGSANAKLRLSYIQYRNRPPSLSLKGSLELLDILLLDKEGKPMVKLPRAAIDIGDAGLFSKKVSIADITVQSPFLSIKRDSKGTLNLLSLVPAKGMEKAPAPPGKKKPAFYVDIGKFSLTGGRVEFSDVMKHAGEAGPGKPQPVRLTADNIAITAAGISTEKDRKASLSLSGYIGKGRMDMTGSASLNPLTAELKMDLKKLDLLPFQPYIGNRIKIGITAGKASASGNISIRTGRQGKYDISWKGDGGISGFSSVDSKTGQEFLKWASLRLEGINAGAGFRKISVKGISLSQFYARVIVQPGGTLNIMEILGREKELPSPRPEKGEGAKRPAPEQPGRQIVIGTSTLEGGTIDFTDRHIEPVYSAKLTGVTGRVSELSSARTSPADVDLFGKWNGYAPLEITGKVNPFGENLFVDLSLDFKDMDLSPLTPFSNKYIGYSIAKGKLALKLKYRIAGKMLTAENLVSLDQLTLGRKVESPDAVRLPVKFAISLLKDRKGEINLNVPVSGRLDDPKFSLGSVIMKAIGKFITRIVTSPFRLIASLFGGGGGENLGYLEFDYGSTSLSPASLKKLGTLITALHERPHLKLDITGYVDPQKDRNSLREMSFQRKLKEQALLDMKAGGKKPVPLEQVEIKPGEYDRILWEVYRKEKFPRPTNFLGIVKKLPPAEMEKLILAHIIITDDDLRRLAHDRAQAARSYILNSRIEAERVFLVEPGSLAPEKKDDITESRVVFTLE